MAYNCNICVYLIIWNDKEVSEMKILILWMSQNGKNPRWPPNYGIFRLIAHNF